MPKKKTASITRLPTRGLIPRGEGEAPADAEAQGEAQAIAARLMKLGARLNIAEPASVDEAWERVVVNHDRAMRAAVFMGFDLIWIKGRVPHGEFGARLEALHIHPRRAQIAMQIARWLVKCESDSHLKKLLDLGPEKLRLLSRVDPEVIENKGVQAEIDLDDVAVMSVADLRKNLRKTRQKSQNLGIQVEHWRTTAHQLQHLTGAPPAGSEHPASVTRARSESAALGDQAQLTISALENQWAALLAAPDLGGGSAERTRNLQVGARSILLHIGAVADAACRALDSARDALGPFLPEADEWGLDDQPLPLHREVATQLAQWRAVHIRQMEISADDREAERVRRGEIKRGQGRPRKTRVLPQTKRRAGRPRKR